ncbi:DUF6291 domain-containing protein [uncultured Alistipes sp.]|uniref:DUF6291 domain-containing protein n=1 Tax=uncultured Alistipes sp. TaxID=538949 RepID=UPI00260601C4|nr:DUF6291 domain-containing protein [uncultured Alistipes sp.]
MANILKTDKGTFILRSDFYPQVQLLTREQRGDLLTAIFAYAATGEILELDGITKMCFEFIKASIDFYATKYDTQCRINRENGMKGGRPKKQSGENQTDNNKTGRFNENPAESEKTDRFLEEPTESEKIDRIQNKPTGKTITERLPEKPEESEKTDRFSEKPTESKKTITERLSEKPEESEKTDRFSEKPTKCEKTITERLPEKPEESEKTDRFSEKPTESEKTENPPFPPITPLSPCECECDSNSTHTVRDRMEGGVGETISRPAEKINPDAARDLLDWISAEFPLIAAMAVPFTEQNMVWMLRKYSVEDIQRIIAAMHNKRAFENFSAYATFNNFAKYDKELAERRNTASASAPKPYTWDAVLEYVDRHRGEATTDDFERQENNGRAVWYKKTDLQTSKHPQA